VGGENPLNFTAHRKSRPKGGGGSMLKEILERLKEGKGVVLSTVLTQTREEIPDEVLYFREGKWILRRINCRSSSDLGLGVCQCTSHPSTVKEEITWEEAVKLIAEYYQREKRKEEEREESRKKFELLLELFSKLEEEPLEKIEEVLHKLLL
jgi:ABC-type multidrug transport system ATPase subunit